MPVRSIFISVVIGSSLILAALVINNARPARQTSESLPAFAQATGRCAQCQREETGAVVHQFERSQRVPTPAEGLWCHGATTVPSLPAFGNANGDCVPSVS